MRELTAGGELQLKRSTAAGRALQLQNRPDFGSRTKFPGSDIERRNRGEEEKN